jgi:hypothetical protein
MSTLLPFLAVSLALLGGASYGVEPQAPARDVRSPQSSAAGAIRGRVLAAQGKSPLRRVRLLLRSPALPEDRIATTDPSGRFEFTELPVGRYRLTATKGSFVPGEFGQRRPGGPGIAIDLARGQALEGADLILVRGAVITGQVMDDLGEPASGVRVGAMRRTFEDGRPRMVPAGRVVETNDLGAYRLFGLAPGSYYLSASGTVWTIGPQSQSESVTTAPTYYPGTMLVSDAQAIAVGAGEERPGIDIALLPVRSVRVSGTAMDSHGGPARSVSLLSLDPVGGLAVSGGVGSAASVQPDGSFALNNVAPGEYALAAMGANAESGEMELAGLRLHIVGDDVGGLMVATTPGTRVAGRVVCDGTGDPPSFATTSMSLSAVPVGDGIYGLPGGNARIASDGTFEFKGVAGSRLLRARVPDGWTLKSVEIEGRDVTDVPIDIRAPHDVSGVTVVLTNRLTSLEGRVTGKDGGEVRDYSLIVFPADRERWTAPRGAASRFLATARPDQRGRFKVAGLPEGDYLTVAVDYLDPGEAADPEFLERMRPKATAVRLPEGGTISTELRLQFRDEQPSGSDR